MHNVSGRCMGMGMGIGLWEWDGNGNSHRNGNVNGREWELIAWERAGMEM